MKNKTGETGAEEPPKHTFVSEPDITEILGKIEATGLTKTEFINRCIRLAGLDASRILRDEKTFAAKELEALLAKQSPPPKAR